MYRRFQNRRTVRAEFAVFYEVCEKTKHKDICEEVLKAQQCGVDIQGIIIEKR